MKSLIVAAAAMVLGTALGFLICGATVRHLRQRVRTLRRQTKTGPPKKMGVMDKVLIFEAVILIAYTVADLAVFWHTGGRAVHPDGLRVRRVRPGKRRHGMDQDQQRQGGGGRQNERERPKGRPGRTTHGAGRTVRCGDLRRVYQ